MHVSTDAIQYGCRLSGSPRETVSGKPAEQGRPAGLVYSAQLQLARTTIDADHKVINLSPGMAVTVEIKIGSIA